MNSDQNQTTRNFPRTRYACLFSDGGLIVMPAGMSFDAARREMMGEDDTTEMLEVEIAVLRSHGRPHVKAVASRHICCPTCGENIYVEENQDGELSAT
jgi:hypothetical protein